MNNFVTLQSIYEDGSILEELMRAYPVLLILSLTLMVSCGGGRNSQSAEVPADSLADTLAVDSLADEISATPMPKAADELFDDFIFNFASNRKLQMERIIFPLTSYQGTKQTKITREQWKMDYFFMRQGYYTLLFDNEQHMEVVKDTRLTTAVVEKIYFNTNSIIQYMFQRPQGAWVLTSIHTIPISQSPNASFLDFYQHFANDKEFQTKSIAATVKFVGPDPDDDFSQMEGILTPDTWEAFAPELPGRMLYNITYGTPFKDGNQKIFVLRGIANGLEMEMVFKRKGNGWKLTKFTT